MERPVRAAKSRTYFGLPDGPFPTIEDAAARAEDAKVFLAFLETRIAAETEESVRPQLVRKRDALAASIATLEKSP